MTNDKAILQLISLKEYLDKNIPLSTADESIDMAIQALRAEQNGGWISVKDRLPEETDIYLVNIHQENEESGETGDFVITAWYQKNSLLFAPKEIGWTLLNEWYDLTPTMREYISHWQPLPDQPKEN